MFLRYKYFGKLKKDKPQENEDQMKYDAFFCVRSLLSYFICKAITVEKNVPHAVACPFRPPLDPLPFCQPKYLDFHSFFGKKWPNNRLASALELVPPV